MIYDYLIVGSGFFGATFARAMTDAGKKCFVIESRKHIGGNAYTEKQDGIDVHMYGPHIFHTNDEKIWEFVNKYTKFNNFVLSPKSYVDGRMYSLPFNMNTFYEMWGCTSPIQAQNIIESQKFIGEPTNLEEQALSLVGKDIYETLIREYTMKQWQKDPKELPSFIIKRLPLRFTYDNNYFNDRYQGIPVDGYTKMIENMLDGIEVVTECDFFEDRKHWVGSAKKVVFTGKIDEFFDYEFGELEYRSLDFVHMNMEETENYQGCAVVNYPKSGVPWTRMIEHKHFTGVKTPNTIVTKEIPTKWDRTKTPYYPINDTKNTEIFRRYRDKAETLDNVLFGGRLADYQYMDMHQVIASALKTVKTELHK